MKIILSTNPLMNFPKVHRGDIIVTNQESENKGSYFWSDAQIAEIENQRRRGLQVFTDKETGGLRVESEEWPPESPPKDPQITIEEYAKERGITL